MPRLSLLLLGAFSATFDDGQEVVSFRTTKMRGLLAYLAIEADRAHPRASLAALFWPEVPDQVAANNLRLNLHRVRRALAQGNGGVLRANRHEVWFDADAAFVDVSEFQRLLDQAAAHHHDSAALCDHCIQRLDRAAGLYRGELLPGFGLADAPVFEEWLLLWRERLQRQALQALSRLALASEQRQDYERMVAYAARQQALDAFDEQAHRQAMRALAASGQRNQALAQFESYRKLLIQEMGIEPDPQTVSLYEQIRRHPPEDRNLAQNRKPSYSSHPNDPPQRPAPAALRNFPAQYTPFVGREWELAQLRRLLLDPTHRLITLTGFGGAGKTRLSIEAARQIAALSAPQIEHFVDGILFCPLADVESAEQLPLSLATDLGLSLLPGEEVSSQVIDYLRHKHMLLVLDNLEQIAGAGAWLVELLDAAPGVVVLVTSRTPLNLQAEERLIVGGLAFPTDLVPLDEAQQYSAIRLFIQTARRVSPGYALSAEDLPAVVRICELVEARPLALEIAARWLRMFDPAGIAAEIEAGFEFLVNSMQDAPDRHRSVAAVFDRTWRLLSPSQQRTLGRLSVFRGAFTLSEAVDIAASTVVDLAHLVDASLLRLIAPGRYDIHDLLRRYASQAYQAALAGRGESDPTAERHSDYFLHLLAAAESDLYGPQPQKAVDRLLPRLDNVRQAWRWAVDHVGVASIWQSLRALGRLLDASGRYEQALALLDMAVQRWTPLCAPSPAQAQVQDAVSQLLAWRAMFLDLQGQATAAIAAARAAVELASRGEDAATLALAHSQLAALLPHAGEFAQGQALQKAAIAGYEDLGDRHGLARAQARLGVLLWRWGRYEDAQAALQRAIALQRGLGDALGLAALLGSMAGVYYEQGRLEDALENVQQAMRMYETAADHRGVSTSAGNLALLYLSLGRYEEALDYNERDLDYCLERGYRRGQATVLGNRGSILQRQGRLDEAASCFLEAIEIQSELQDEWEIARHRASLASVWLQQDRAGRARAALEQALPALRRHGAAYYLLSPLADYAEALLALGDVATAQDAAQELRQHAEELGLPERVTQSEALLDRIGAL